MHLSDTDSLHEALFRESECPNLFKFDFRRGGGRIDSRMEVDPEEAYDEHSFVRLQWDPGQ